jgi:peptide-methionine (S)-S-oxide reductase
MTRVALALAVVALVLPVVLRAGVTLPDPAIDDSLAPSRGRATLTLAGGCFWGVEAVYDHTRGVLSATSGYAGGTATTARFDFVKSGTTAHAETVQVTYDPSTVTMGTLLKVFFSAIHDPTQRGRQGPDVGPQYRSIIFYANERQQEIAQAYIAQLTQTRAFEGSITTQVLRLGKFYRAEEELQDFVKKNPTYIYVRQYDTPMLDEFGRAFPALFVK